MTTPAHIGVIVHPSRAIEEPLGALREWVERSHVQLVQIPVATRQPEIAELRAPDECDLIVSIGGDGTMLGALRAASIAGRPVLGVACGSLGVLTTVAAGDLVGALDRFAAADWIPRALPALDVHRETDQDLFALNDVAVVRAGPGQLSIAARVDGAEFAEFAGDGCIVSTPVGSSAYALAAGGPLMVPDTAGFLLTPLSVHGGFCPPLVLAADAKLELVAVVGHGGARLELDGQLAATEIDPLAISFRHNVATMVAFADQEPILTRLRRRKIIIDSPRILAGRGRY